MHLDVYGSLSATHFDPIEKKPLYHFHPGKEIFSLGSLGCNFKCPCCQNYHISQSGIKDFPRLLKLTIPEIIRHAKSNPLNIGVAYTYNEPFVWYEYMFDTSQEIKKAGLYNVAVSNGYINKKPLEELTLYIDAFNIDIKGFDDGIYRSFAGGKLSNILDSLQIIKGRNCHLEITFLVVPEINDDIGQFRQMIRWIVKNLGSDVPLHISRYFPNYKMHKQATSSGSIRNMARLASEFMSYVYVGNMTGNEFQDTVCPKCQQITIIRDGYYIGSDNLTTDGKCQSCGHKIAIV
ncbi:hypothetical protein ES703_97339 [subsurface metagenome]